MVNVEVNLKVEVRGLSQIMFAFFGIFYHVGP